MQGTSVNYSPQRVGINHIVQHEDVIQIVKKWHILIIANSDARSYSFELNLLTYSFVLNTVKTG